MNNKIIEVVKYLRPHFVYIPLTDILGKSYTIKKHKNDYVFKGELIGTSDNFNLYSPVSGYIINSEKHLNSSNKLSKYLKIENDYKEKIAKNKVTNIIYYNKDTLIDILFKSSVLNYKPDKVDILIINLLPKIDINNNDIYIKNKCPLILEVIDKINSIINNKLTYIVINDKSKSINILNNYIKEYPNIKLKLTNRKYFDDDLFVENMFHVPKKKTILLNINQIVSINSLLQYNSPLMEKIITIKLNGKKNKLLNVKVGTLASEILSKINIKNNHNNLLVVGSLLKGTSLASDDFVIDQSIESIHIMKDNFNKKENCLRCGKCMVVCPYGIVPVEIKDKIINNKKLSHTKIDKCTLCGLCAYHCPAKIELTEYLKKAKEREQDYAKI